MAAGVLFSARTTGWTDKTRNQFHPGDVISTIKMYFGFSPFRAVGITELACHLIGEGREACMPRITEDGSVLGFYFNVVPRLEKARPYLREKFPQLAAFADGYTAEELDQMLTSDEAQEELIKKVESLFGKTIEVYPIKNFSQKSEDIQLETLRSLEQRFPGKVFVIPSSRL